MNEIKMVDISHIRFSSTAQPTEEDVKLWKSLTPDEQHAVSLRELEEARKGGLAPKQTMAEIIAESQANIAHEL